MPDPSIQPAIDEIAAVLKKHDMCGLVVVGSPSHTQFLLALDPTWSCIRKDGEKVRFRAKSSEFPSKAAAKKTVENSLGLLLGLSGTARNCAAQLERLAEKVAESVGEVQHTNRLEEPNS